MTRIDSHLHVFAKVSPEFPREPTPVCPADREETAEKLLGEMEANGVDQAMLVQTGGTEIKHHAYLLHCLKTYPDRFLGIGLVPPDLTEPEDHMDRLTDGTGIIGFPAVFDWRSERPICSNQHQGNQNLSCLETCCRRGLCPLALSSRG